jgi:sugar phosphate isomerase/epimerase
MSDRLALDFLSRFCLPPVESVRLADDLGCRHIGICFEPYVANPEGYPSASLRDDPALRRGMMAEMMASGVSISIGEGFMISPAKDIAAAAGDLDLMAELGAPLVNILSLDSDYTRSVDQIATFVNLAAERGMRSSLEFVPGLVVGDLPTALNVLRHVDSPSLKLSVDFMHLYRSGGTAADVAALDPRVIGYAQLCDVPMVAQVPDYAEEACNYRLPPGEGELPLLDTLRVIPRDVLIGIEIPMLKLAEEGIGPRGRLAPCVDRARELLRRV